MSGFQGPAGVANFSKCSFYHVTNNAAASETFPNFSPWTPTENSLEVSIGNWQLKNMWGIIWLLWISYISNNKNSHVHTWYCRLFLEWMIILKFLKTWTLNSYVVKTNYLVKYSLFISFLFCLYFSTSCYSHYTQILQSLHTDFIVTTHRFYSHYTHILQSLHTDFTVTTHRFYSHYTQILQSLHTDFTVTTHRFSVWYQYRMLMSKWTSNYLERASLFEIICIFV